MNYTEWSEQVKRCRKCKLCETRTQVVVGDGNPNADILFVGEAPGKDEDLQGLPFVGRSGKLLRQKISEIGLTAKDIYITNIVKCRPPDNRDPERDEIVDCSPYLIEQIRDYIKPKFVVGVGRISSGIIYEGYKRGVIYNFDNYEFMGIYHPAATIYDPDKLVDFVSDLQKLKNYIRSQDKFW